MFGRNRVKSDAGQVDEESPPVYTRKGRRANQDIREGVAEYHEFKKDGDEEAMRLSLRGRTGGKRNVC